MQLSVVAALARLPFELKLNTELAVGTIGRCFAFGLDFEGKPLGDGHLQGLGPGLQVELARGIQLVGYLTEVGGYLFPCVLLLGLE